MSYQIGDKVWIFSSRLCSKSLLIISDDHPTQAEIEGYVGSQYYEHQWRTNSGVYTDKEIFPTKEIAEMVRILDQ